MSREEFLQRLGNSLSGKIPQQEIADILAYYQNYFDDAGAEHEVEAIAGLGLPEDMAQQLLLERDRTYAGYRKKRRFPKWVVVLLGLGCIGAIGRGALTICGFTGHSNIRTVGNTVFDTVENAVSEQISNGSFGVSENDMPAFESIDIEANVSDVDIVIGDSYGMELSWDNEKLALTYENSDGKLEIWNEGGEGLTNIEAGRIVIYLPENAVMSNLTISLGMGDITMEEITTDGGVIETGMGDIELEGTFLGDTKIETGMGNIKLTTTLTADKCGYDLSVGLGEIEVNGEEMGNSIKKDTDTDDKLTLNSGMGDIDVAFGESE